MLKCKNTNYARTLITAFFILVPSTCILACCKPCKYNNIKSKLFKRPPL